MSCRRHTSRLFSLAKPWLAGLLVLLMLGVAIESAGHHHGSARVNHQDCAACQMAHGTVLADGLAGISCQLPSTEIVLELVWNLTPCGSSDLLLSDGRAPPA
jgi:hypothetical protein